MSLHTLSIEDKLAVVEAVIRSMRPNGRQDPEAARSYEALKAVAADLRARLEHPRSNALGSLGRALAAVKASKGPLGYDQGKLLQVANIVINKWPTISQALEQFGEESAE